jgi:hypothetical protein
VDDKAFLCESGDEVAIAQDAGGGIGVEGVKTEN